MQWLEMAFRLPAAAMQLGIKAFSDMWGAVQGNAAQGVDGLVSQVAHGLSSRQQPPPPDSEAEPISHDRPAHCCPWSDECLKLVRYQVLFVKRGLEVAFPAREELIWENVTALQFQTWKVAEFVSGLNLEPVPPKWLEKDYPPDREQREIDGRQIWVIHALPPGDEKYLRLRCQVLRTYPRERLRFAERQLAELAGIRDAIAGPGRRPSVDSSAVGLQKPALEISLATEQEYQAVVAASRESRAEVAVQEKAARPKKPKAANKAKAGKKKAAKPKAKKKSPPKGKSGAKKTARTRKRSSA